MATWRFIAAFNGLVTFGGRPGELPLVLTGDEGMTGFATVREAIATAMTDAGLPRRATAPFTPHMTVAYGGPAGFARLVEPITWPVDQFSLIESHRGAHRHVTIKTWPLRPRILPDTDPRRAA